MDDIRDKNRFRRCTSYFTASAITGILVVLYLILRSSLSDFMKGFSNLFNEPSILDEKHNFNKYVHEYYELTYQNEDAYYPIMIYSRKENYN